MGNKASRARPGAATTGPEGSAAKAAAKAKGLHDAAADREPGMARLEHAMGELSMDDDEPSTQLPQRKASSASSTESDRGSTSSRGGFKIKMAKVPSRHNSALKDRKLLTGTECDDKLTARIAYPARTWTPAQDAALRAAVERHKAKNWKAIAELVPGQNHVQCLQRWSKVLQPGLKKGPWTESEDRMLFEAVTSSPSPNSISWAGIAAKISGRTAKQCRERWTLNVDPSIKRGEWEPEEDQRLLELQATLGNKWADISSSIPGRTENAVKTRYKSLLRRMQKAWTPEEDRIIIEAKRASDSRWSTIADSLPSRTKNAIKLRWKQLVQENPSLGEPLGMLPGHGPAPTQPTPRMPTVPEPQAVQHWPTHSPQPAHIDGPVHQHHQQSQFTSHMPAQQFDLDMRRTHGSHPHHYAPPVHHLDARAHAPTGSMNQAIFHDAIPHQSNLAPHHDDHFYQGQQAQVPRPPKQGTLRQEPCSRDDWTLNVFDLHNQHGANHHQPQHAAQQSNVHGRPQRQSYHHAEQSPPLVQHSGAEQLSREHISEDLMQEAHSAILPDMTHPSQPHETDPSQDATFLLPRGRQGSEQNWTHRGAANSDGSSISEQWIDDCPSLLIGEVSDALYSSQGTPVMGYSDGIKLERGPSISDDEFAQMFSVGSPGSEVTGPEYVEHGSPETQGTASVTASPPYGSENPDSARHGSDDDLFMVTEEAELSQLADAMPPPKSLLAYAASDFSQISSSHLDTFIAAMNDSNRSLVPAPQD